MAVDCQSVRRFAPDEEKPLNDGKDGVSYMNSLEQFSHNLTSLHITDCIDIAIVAFLIYQIFKLVRKTSSARLIRGVIVLLLAMWVAEAMNLVVLTYLFQTVFTWGILVLAIVFQPELRRGLERMGKSKFIMFMVRDDSLPIEERSIKEIIKACSDMSWSRTGALIIFERKENLEDIMKTGTRFDAEVQDELIRTIFYEGSPLHDGATIIRDGRIAAGGCVLPLSPNPNIAKELGTRHRAAVGMSEKADSVSLVVSEETGSISVAIDGKLQRHLAPEQLEEILREELLTVEDISDNGLFKRLSTGVESIGRKMAEFGRRKK